MAFQYGLRDIPTVANRAVDAAGEMRLADSKTGARFVPLPAAARVLASHPRIPGNPWVFPGRKKGDRLSYFAHGSAPPA